MLIFNFYFYNRIKELIRLIKSLICIKYCNNFRIYCIRESILLNLNFNRTGGVYNNFPGKDRIKYASLIRSKLTEFFIETQSHLTEILSSSYSPSKNIEKKEIII